MRDIKKKLTWRGLRCAWCKRIAHISWYTCACWNMVYNSALSKLSTHSRTWIFTFITHTGSISGTIRTENTLWATAFVRITLIIWDTAACTCTITLCTHSICSTWRRLAWVRYLFCKEKCFYMNWLFIHSFLLPVFCNLQVRWRWKDCSSDTELLKLVVLIFEYT